MAIISLSGKINSGKDTIAEIIQIITNSPHFTNEAVFSFIGKPHLNPKWEIKRFADKLKDIVCMLLGCSREQLENREFKEKELGEEWHKYQHENGQWYCTIEHYNSLTKNRQAYWSLIKLTPRLLLQLLGTQIGRQIIHPNIWCNSLMSEYVSQFNWNDSGKEGLPNWIITDMRFPNELKAVEDRNGITIRVNRKSFKWIDPDEYEIQTGKKVERVVEHESETSLDSAIFDYTIDNDGTLLELVGKVREILILEKII